MTDKEMAEEYFKTTYPAYIGCDKFTEEIKDAVIYGLKVRTKWHDLRKNPDDLPKEGDIVLCYCLGYCGASYPITARMYVDYEDSRVHYWWTLAGEGKEEQLDNVIAWKEIISPKLEE